MIMWLFNELNNKEINQAFIITDKDFIQIQTVKRIWQKANIQLCYFAFKICNKKAISINKKTKNILYSAINAKAEFLFIDLDFYSNIVLLQPEVENNELESVKEIDEVNKQLDKSKKVDKKFNEFDKNMININNKVVKKTNNFAKDEL
ncbi:15164_t:CDS:2 [Cetraspora pellucida]|uniref:15164_t:CDS:1 n=1 Tax=Cetraspora pellucida TaxID=1433469 RepID=A0A9N9IKC7_9GLOM|nr:15164_t:CDS:2 [Cetraspora pellucida]